MALPRLGEQAGAEAHEADPDAPARDVDDAGVRRAGGRGRAGPAGGEDPIDVRLAAVIRKLARMSGCFFVSRPNPPTPNDS